MRPFYLLILLIIAACGVKHSTVDYGQTTEAELVAKKGPAIREEKIPVSEGKVLVFEHNEKYQIEGAVVTNGFKTPTGDGRTVIYWRHQFRDCDTQLRRVNQKLSGHEMPEWELACPAQGKSVVYTEGSDFISRVIEYAKK